MNLVANDTRIARWLVNQAIEHKDAVTTRNAHGLMSWASDVQRPPLP